MSTKKKVFVVFWATLIIMFLLAGSLMADYNKFKGASQVKSLKFGLSDDVQDERVKRIALIKNLKFGLSDVVQDENIKRVALIKSLKFGLDDDIKVCCGWSNTCDKEAKMALYKSFNKLHPDIKIVETYTSGKNYNEEMKLHLLTDSLPDTFEIVPGANFINTYVEGNRVAPLTSKMEKWGLKDKIRPELLEMCSYNGEIYALPVSVNFGNFIFCNEEIVTTNEILTTIHIRSVYEFIEALKVLDKNNITPLALGTKDEWSATMLYEAIVNSLLGPDKYRKLWNGEVSFDDPEIRETLVAFRDMTRYINDNHSDLTWQEAADLVHDNKAGFIITGDWVEGYFNSLGWQPGVDYSWIKTSGSGLVSIPDAFCLSTQACNSETALAWLKNISSISTQKEINQIRGSIPARTDIIKGDFDMYQIEAMLDYSRKDLLPSVAHGLYFPEDTTHKINEIFLNLLEDGDIEKAQLELKSIVT